MDEEIAEILRRSKEDRAREVSEFENTQIRKQDAIRQINRARQELMNLSAVLIEQLVADVDHQIKDKAPFPIKFKTGISCLNVELLYKAEFVKNCWGDAKYAAPSHFEADPNQDIYLRMEDIKFTKILAKEWLACCIRSGGKYKDLKGHLVANDLAIVVKSTNPIEVHVEQEVLANASRITFD